MTYYYKILLDKTKIPDDTTEFNCDRCNLTELPELPRTLKELICYCNYLTELQELHIGIEKLWIDNNNIKYLSYDNCNIIKNIILCRDRRICLKLLPNPVCDGFDSCADFQQILL
jgi:hypothetical protein